MTKNENVVTFLQLKVSESQESETFVTHKLTMYTDIHQENRYGFWMEKKNKKIFGGSIFSTRDVYRFNGFENE